MRHLNFDPYPSRTRGGPWVTLVATLATMRMPLICKCPTISIVSKLSGFWGVSTIKWNSYPTLLSFQVKSLHIWLWINVEKDKICHPMSWSKGPRIKIIGISFLLGNSEYIIIPKRDLVSQSQRVSISFLQAQPVARSSG